MPELLTGDARSVAKQIIRYFLRNPEAADTLDGIARWRLLDEQIYQSVQMTEAALNFLVAMGLLEAERSASAGTIYHIDKSRWEEAKRFATTDLTGSKP